MGSIKIDVDFYNNKEKEKFKKNYPDYFPQIEAVVGKQVEIPLEDFKSFFLFRHQTTLLANNLTFNDFLTQLPKKWGYFDDHFSYTTTKDFIATHVPNDTVELAESIGVAGALSLSSKIFIGVTQADWTKIPILTTKDLDFKHLASDSKKYLVVESKGSIVDDNTNPSTVYYHKRSILDKKCDDDFKKKYSTATDICYGVITVADTSNTLKAWFVDPPVLPQNIDPVKYKLLSRLYFYNDYVRLISSRSYLSLALPNRIISLQNTYEFGQYDKSPIVNSRFEKIKISKAFIESRSWYSKSKDSFTVGRCTILEGYIYFIGLDVSIMDMLIEQQFDTINQFKSTPSSFSQKVNCIVHLDEITKNTLTKAQIVNSDYEGKSIALEVDFELSMNSSGVVFGRTKI